ncbi:HGGxSTG domain-containing protein [Pararhizobium capsulatum]|uniref:HGGxSTG domain-containing protein n=1 Tax=Pararhizobium capsulatum TaxID=34014 RepID=UPI0027D784D2|nr:HGGxSTG domain-containing protein [Pararhizobium capsulatum]
MFGADWPGKRCLAKTRAGYLCQKPALKGRTRCQLHGGRAGAPTGKRNGNYNSGRFTKEAILARKEAVRRIRALIELGRTVGMFR